MKAIRNLTALLLLFALSVVVQISVRAEDGKAPPPSGTSDASAALGTEAKNSNESPVLKAPDFKAKDLQGKEIKASDLLKKGPILVDFWTTWCGPCKREMPELDKLYKKYRDRGFTVVAISQDEPRTVQKVKPYIDTNKFELLVLTDPSKSVGNLFNVRQYPTSYLIAQDRKIIHFAESYLPGDEKRLEELVRGLLGLGAEGEDSGSPK